MLLPDVPQIVQRWPLDVVGAFVANAGRASEPRIDNEKKSVQRLILRKPTAPLADLFWQALLSCLFSENT